MTTAQTSRVALRERFAAVPAPVTVCTSACAALGVAELLALGRYGCTRCGAAPIATGAAR